MRKVALALVLALFAFSTPLSAATFRLGGAYVTIFGRDTSGCVELYVSAYQTGTATYLIYDLLAVCLPIPQTIASDYLQIPNTSVVVTRAQTTLAVSLPVGKIQLTLVRDGLQSYTASGQERLDIPDLSIRSHGTRSEQSAVAAGDVFNFVVAAASGVIGTSRDLYVEIVKK